MNDNVTVIIPVGRAHLPVFRRAITSAREADQIIIVYDGDFGSTPPFATSHKQTYYWHDFPHGVCAARNTALSNVDDGSLVLPLDADDELLPGAIDALIAAYTPHSIVYGDWLEQSPLITPESFQRAPILNAHNEPIVESVRVIAPPPERVKQKNVCHATYLFAKEDWRMAGGYNPDYHVGAEDYEFMLHMIRNGCTLHKVDAPIYRRHTADSYRTEIARDNAEIIRMLLQRDYGDWLDA